MGSSVSAPKDRQTLTNPLNTDYELRTLNYSFNKLKQANKKKMNSQNKILNAEYNNNRQKILDNYQHKI